MSGGRCTLRFKTGPLAGTTHSLGPGEFVYVGKGEGCALRLQEDPTVSEVHACVFYDPAGVVRLKDMGSEYGTFKNGKRLTAATKLKAGDRITVGQVSTFQSSWWNALQSTRLTRFTRISAMRKNLVAPKSLRAGRGPGAAAAAAGLFFTALAVAFYFWRGADPAPPVKLVAKAPPVKSAPAAKPKKPKKVVAPQTAPASSVSANQRFIWDEIVAVSRRFGDPPPSAMDLGFVRQVEKNIRKFTLNERHRGVLDRKKTHWPVITRILRERNLPVELGYIVWVESKFVREAESPVGAKGLWQFMPATAKEYGLAVRDGRDDRVDPVKSTAAAAAYIGDLLRMFGTDRYLLALASYNTGQFRVQRLQLAATIHDAQKKDFWEIRDKLPAETNAYVPQIMAAIIVGRNPDRWSAPAKVAH